MRYTALLLLIIPIFAGAAGFAKGSLFLSRSNVTEGEAVRVYTVVSNDATTTFTGSVIFTDGTLSLGSVAVTLTVGEAQTVSVYWKPTAGTHTVTAKLTSKSGTVAESESSNFTVKEKPKPVDTASTTYPIATYVESSQAIEDTVGNYVPAASGVIAPALDFIDSLRGKGAEAIQKGIDWSKAKMASKGQVEGAEDSKGSWMDTAMTMLATLSLYGLTVLLFVISHIGAFYPVIAIIFFYLLWKLFRGVRRPA